MKEARLVKKTVPIELDVPPEPERFDLPVRRHQVGLVLLPKNEFLVHSQPGRKFRWIGERLEMAEHGTSWRPIDIEKLPRNWEGLALKEKSLSGKASPSYV